MWINLKLLRLSAITLCSLALPCGSAGAPLDKQKLAASVVVLKSAEALRSAVVIAPQTIVSTCSIKYYKAPLSVVKDGVSYAAELQYADPHRGLCQYSVANLPVIPAEKGSAKNLKVKNSVWVVGAKDDSDVTVDTGVITALRAFEESNFIQLSVPITPKLSGAGVFNSVGELVGITQGALKNQVQHFLEKMLHGKKL